MNDQLNSQRSQLTLAILLAAILALVVVSYALAQGRGEEVPDFSESTKTVSPGSATVGSRLNYAVVVKNSGNVKSDIVVMTDTLPTEVTYIADSLTVTDNDNAITLPGYPMENGGVIEWRGRLGIDGTTTLIFSADLTSGDVDDVITNSADISDTVFGQDMTVSADVTIVAPSDNTDLFLPILLRPSDDKCYYYTIEDWAIIEYEDILDNQDVVDPDWALQTEESGYTGSGYLNWQGENFFGTPGNGILTFNLNVLNSGLYEIHLHNFHDAEKPDGSPDPSEENDVWIKLNDESWIKLFSGIDYPIDQYPQWTWNSNFEIGHNIIAPVFQIDAGLHELHFSARSHNFRIDRIALYQKYQEDVALDLSIPARQCLVLPEPPE